MNRRRLGGTRPGLLQLVYGAQRRATSVTDRMAQRIARMRRDQVAGLPQAACDFLGVLDGRTLNLHAVLPAPTDGGTCRAELALVRDRRVLTCPATIRQGPDGRLEVEVLARLGQGPGEIPLGKGIWSMALTVGLPGSVERQFALRVAEPEDTGGPTTTMPPHPVSGWHYRPTRSRQGLAQLTVIAPRARAEVARINITHTESRIQARLVGVRMSEGAEVVFTPRAAGPDVVVPIDTVDDTFEFVVPVAELSSGPPGHEVVWEAWVRTSPTRMIRLGRFLHDLRDPRSVLRASRASLPLGGDEFVGYRPYYTQTGNLAVACLRFARFTGMPR